MSRQQNRYQSPFGRSKAQENGGPGQQQGGLSHQQFLSGAGVQAALGGLSYGVNGRPLNGPTSIPYLQPSIFASPKAAAGGRMNSEPPTPTSGASGASGGLAAGRPTAQTPTGRGALGSPKIGSGYNPVTGAATSTPTRRNSGSLNATAPPGSLAGIQRMVDAAAAGGGLGSTMGRGSGSGAGIFGSTNRTGSGILGSTLSGNANLSATMPAATGSRPPTAGQAALLSTAPAGGSRPGTGLAGQLARANSAVPGLSFSVGSNQSMGARGYQEDYRAIADPTSTPGMTNLPNVLLGAAVYDGHGGKQVSHWLASSYCLLNRCMEAVQHLVATGGSPNDVAGVLDDVFSACGSAAISGRMTAGSCVALMLLVQAAGVPWVLSANVGDSRTVLVSWDDPAEGGGGITMMGMTLGGGGGGGGRPEGVALSVDHKLGPAKTSEETRRVQAAGGTVIQLFGTWRIDGSLAVARAIGDSDFQRYVSYHPTVSCRQLARRDRWVIIASDGLWDVMTNEEVALFCRAQHQLSAAKLAEALVREAVRNRGSGDNTTVVAVRLQYNPPAPAAS